MAKIGAKTVLFSPKISSRGDSEAIQISKMERFVKIVKGSKPLPKETVYRFFNEFAVVLWRLFAFIFM